ncbi:MAG TPA: NAD(P)-dependent alcohol dehydrogenase [Chryseolinea sp.]
MKAAVRSEYGPPEVLKIKEVETPTPGKNDLLISVQATTVNRSDYHVLTGKPLFMRLFTGFFKPRLASTGCDFAGTVEQAGKEVTSFRIGDRVMGFGDVIGIGTHAQFVTIGENAGVVHMPESLTFQEAAACIEGAYYASVPIRKIKPTAGQKALVYGATGAIGSSYLQFLKYYHVYTTAVCNTKDFDLAKSLGADRCIDYKKEDFTKDNERYDFVFDAVGKRSFYDCKVLMKEKGSYMSSGGLINILPTLYTPLLGGKRALFIPPTDIKGGLLFIKELIEKGKFKPVIDRVYPLERITEAYNYVATGEKIGNVVLSIEH